jgi:hypothetical protein
MQIAMSIVDMLVITAIDDLNILPLFQTRGEPGEWAPFLRCHNFDEILIFVETFQKLLR